MELKKIAVIRNGFIDKFGVPRQSGIVDEVISEIVFEKEYRNDEALRGIEGYSHLWLLWIFSANEERTEFCPTVRPPRLGGNKRMGVFATRSPFRPNPIGLSSVRLLSVEKRKDSGTVLVVSGADLTDGTPIIDVKPYIKYTDSHPDAISGFADGFVSYRLKTVCPGALAGKVEEKDRRLLLDLVSCDPRPSYQTDPERVYMMDYGNYKVGFKVDGDTAHIISIEKTEGKP